MGGGSFSNDDWCNVYEVYDSLKPQVWPSGDQTTIKSILRHICNNNSASLDANVMRINDVGPAVA